MNIKISLPRDKLLKSVLLSLFYTQGNLNLNQLPKWYSANGWNIPSKIGT